MSAKPRRRWLRWAALLFLLGLLLIGRGLWNAGADPIVRTASVAVADWPAGEPPMRVLLISDTHVAGPDMPPERLRAILRRFNALKPDLLLVAGDFHSGKYFATRHYSASEQTAPFGEARARLGVIAVIGNHDHWADAKAIEAGLRARGVTVLNNGAVRRGPLIVGGVDDWFTEHADLPATYAAMDALGAGPRILVIHSPDVVPDLPAPVAAVFAGHTHCGQIAPPLIGALTYSSAYGDRFACGDMTDKGQRLFVGAGLGTSILPLRYGVPPDVWLVTLGPRR
ncbi:MAG TPA: metallophosphoesterase [Sphingopyxis sp.]|nr:metallophosphoesterase [Sphingopyxis sp.]HMP44495.1 metallophosphoesterase [Sphingopyxis sp.]HMQ20561.1 metallophosphoesterase [Sphingopyxis sp.]